MLYTRAQPFKKYVSPVQKKSVRKISDKWMLKRVDVEFFIIVVTVAYVSKFFFRLRSHSS